MSLSLSLLPLSASLNLSLVLEFSLSKDRYMRGQEAYPLAVSSSQSKAHQKAGSRTRNAGEKKLRGSVIQLTHPYVRLYMCPDSTIYASAYLWYNPRPATPLHSTYTRTTSWYTHAHPAGSALHTLICEKTSGLDMSVIPVALEASSESSQIDPRTLSQRLA